MTPRDHDTLIKVQTNQENMCKKMDRVIEILDRLDGKLDKKVSWQVYTWTLGGAVGTVAGVLGYYGKLLYDIIKGA